MLDVVACLPTSYITQIMEAQSAGESVAADATNSAELVGLTGSAAGDVIGAAVNVDNDELDDDLSSLGKSTVPVNTPDKRQRSS